MLKLLKTEKIKGKIRLYFICGLRLLKDYNEKHQLVTELTKTLTTGQALLIHQVVKMKQDKNEKERKYVSLFNQYAELLSKQLVKEQGKEKVFQIYQNHSIKELNILSEKLIKNGVEFIVLATKEENKLIISQTGILPSIAEKWLRNWLEN